MVDDVVPPGQQRALDLRRRSRSHGFDRTVPLEGSSGLVNAATSARAVVPVAGRAGYRMTRTPSEVLSFGDALFPGQGQDLSADPRSARTIPKGRRLAVIAHVGDHDGSPRSGDWPPRGFSTMAMPSVSNVQRNGVTSRTTPG